MVKRLSKMWETWVRSLGWEDPLEKEMAIHSGTVAWKIPWTEESGGGGGYLQSHCCACMHAKSLQLCLTLCDPMDCS